MEIRRTDFSYFIYVLITNNIIILHGTAGTSAASTLTFSNLNLTFIVSELTDILCYSSTILLQETIKRFDVKNRRFLFLFKKI
jgi:hypothetical protein